MARTKKNNVDYFPHYVSHGKKMFCLRAKYKNDGYAVWFMLLEKLGNAENHYLDLSSETEKIYLSSELMVSEEVLFDIINMLVTLEVFDSELWHKENILYNQEFVNNIQDVYNRRTGRECINRESLIDILSSMGRNKCSSKAILKPSKAVKPVKDNSVRKLDFDWLWDVYDLKKEKKKALDIWLKLSDKDIKKVKDTIVQYVSINKGQYQKYLYKYLKDENFNEDIQEVKKEISSNGYTTVKKVVDLFNETEFPATIKELKTSKDNLRVRLHEFLERESLEAKFKNRDLNEVLKHFVRAVQYMKPKIVNNVDPNAKAPWVTYAEKHN